jgi:uncharacterized DUF497 family protein
MISGGYIDFEWDPGKAASNERKHGVTFAEASTVFGDPYARVIDDPDHSDDEERFIILGASTRANVLIVCHCYRSGGDTIRIISARNATKTESKAYWRCCHEG